MYLKKINLLGFKTFADKTSLEFSPGITCIVGPNGGGKSNVADSLRFCLGEQSTKSLRALRLEEIIFAGSSKRKMLGLGEVEMILDNADKTLPVEFGEVSITRRIFREGENQFFVNKTPCRLRDIQELLMGTGIGSGGLTFLSQNEVDLVLSSAENRRMIIEEIAGTNKYKFRKKEASRKLAQTDLNLSRLHDILNEIDNQLKSLESQVRKFRRYNKYKVLLVESEKNYLLAKLKKLDVDYGPIINEIAEVKKLEEELNEKIIKLEEIKDGESKHLWENEERLAKIEESVTNIRLAVQKQNDFKELIEERIRNAAQTRELSEKEIENLAHIEDSCLLKISEYHSAIEGCKVELEDINRRLLDEANHEAKIRNEKLPAGLNLGEKYHAIINELADIKSQISSVTEKHKYAEHEITKLEARFNDISAKVSEYEKTIAKNAASKNKLEESLDANKKILSGLESVYLNEWEKICALNEQETNLNKEIGALSARQELLKKLEKELNYHWGATPVILDKKEAFPGIFGSLTRLVNFPQRLTFSIESILRYHLEDLVVDTESQAYECINYLKENKNGFVTCWPCDVVSGENIVRPELPQDTRVLGWASDLIQVGEKHKKVFDIIFDNILIVEDFNTAKVLRNHFRESNSPVTIVTLQGDVFLHNGAIRGGDQNERPILVSWDKEYEKINQSLASAKSAMQASVSEKTNLEENRLKTNNIIKFKEKVCEHISAKINNLLVKENFLLMDKGALIKEQGEINTRLNDIKTETSLLKNALTNFEEELIMKEEEHTLLEADFSSQKDLSSKIDEEIESVKGNIQKLLIRQAEIKQKESDLNEKCGIFEKQIDESKEKVQKLHEQIRDCAEKISQSEDTRSSVENEIKAINLRSEEILKEKEEITLRVRDIERKYKETLSDINNIKKQKEEYHDRFYKLELRKVEYETKYSDYKNMLADYKVTFEEINWEEVDLPDFAAAEKQISRLKNFINSFGGVNLAAEDDYNQFKTRQEFLSGQIADLESAKESLLSAIKEYDENCIVKFNEIFNEIAVRFQRIFTEVFNGGTAEMALSDPDDILDSGVEIKAQPPGKKLQNLSLLSGGERALTSVAFLFALLEVKPTPFILLDELDAPLDDSNIERVALLIRKYSEVSQFIIITHNRKTMEAADILYGVTMEEQGVSKILTVKLQEAQKEYSYKSKKTEEELVSKSN